MAANQSNLSDSKYGYDLVVATTQASINSTMKEFLNSITASEAPEVVVCYVTDDSGDLVEIEYDTLKKNANGSDPFSVPHHSDIKTNQDLLNLANANFAGGFKVQIGLPDLELDQLPPIVTLEGGTEAPVKFNLLCSEFQVVGYFSQYPKTWWINQSELTGASSGTAWYFTANVKLNNSIIDPKSPVPPDVQQRINELNNSVGAGAFSVQKLFLDLDTAILLTIPTVTGIPDTWPVWNLIKAQFMDEYFKQMQKTGHPILAYSCSLNEPDPSTLHIGAMTKECCLLRDSSGNPIKDPNPAEQNAATFNYLCTTGTTSPVATLFPWNWIELTEVVNYSGLQAVKRNTFANYLANVLNAAIASLCIVPSVSLTQGSGFEDNYWILYSTSISSSPTTFVATAPGTVAGSDGFTTLLNLTHFSSSTGYQELTAHDDLTSINGEFSYTLDGNVAVKGNQIRLTLHAVANMAFGHHELGVKYYDLPGANYVDKILTITFDLNVTGNGQLVVNSPIPTVTDNSAAWNFNPEGILSWGGNEDDVKGGITKTDTALSSFVSNGFTSTVSAIEYVINSSRSWVFPGGKTFAFSRIFFSDYQDLISHVTYVTPT